MIQDVKLGTHKIGTYMYAINKCTFLLGFYLEMPLRSDLNKIIRKLINVGVERGVATRMAQVMWPMMIVTLTNFEGSNSEILAKMWILGENEQFQPFSPKIHIFANISKLLPSEALKICRTNYHHRPHHLSHSCGHTPFHTHIN